VEARLAVTRLYPLLILAEITSFNLSILLIKVIREVSVTSLTTRRQSKQTKRKISISGKKASLPSKSS